MQRMSVGSNYRDQRGSPNDATPSLSMKMKGKPNLRTVAGVVGPQDAQEVRECRLGSLGLLSLSGQVVRRKFNAKRQYLPPYSRTVRSVPGSGVY